MPLIDFRNTVRYNSIFCRAGTWKLTFEARKWTIAAIFRFSMGLTTDTSGCRRQPVPVGKYTHRNVGHYYVYDHSFQPPIVLFQRASTSAATIFNSTNDMGPCRLGCRPNCIDLFTKNTNFRYPHLTITFPLVLSMLSSFLGPQHRRFTRRRAAARELGYVRAIWRG